MEIEKPNSPKIRKRTKDAIALAERLGIDPLETLLNIAAGDYKALGYNEAHVIRATANGVVEEDRITVAHRVQAALAAVPYIYKKQATEITGADGGPIHLSALTNEELVDYVASQKVLSDQSEEDFG